MDDIEKSAVELTKDLNVFFFTFLLQHIRVFLCLYLDFFAPIECPLQHRILVKQPCKNLIALKLVLQSHIFSHFCWDKCFSQKKFSFSFKSHNQTTEFIV